MYFVNATMKAQVMLNYYNSYLWKVSSYYTKNAFIMYTINIRKDLIQQEVSRVLNKSSQNS